MNAFETTLDQANSPFKQLVIGQYDGTELLNKLTIEGRDREIFLTSLIVLGSFYGSNLFWTL